MKRAEPRRVSVLMATAFVDMIGFAIVFPLLPFYALRLGGEEWMVGPLVAAYSIAQLASSPLWGRVSDRYGRRPVILFGLLAGAVAYVIFGFAEALWLLFAARLAQGSGGGTTGVLQAYIADATPPRDRARALGWLSAATSAGVMIGPALGSLAATWGYAAPGLLAAGLCLLNFGFAARWLPESAPLAVPNPNGPARVRRPIRSAFWEVLRHPRRPVSRLIWMYATGMAAFTSMAVVLPLFLYHRFGVTERTIGYFFVYTGTLNVVMRALILGWAVDRLGEDRVMHLGATVLALSFALLPFAGSIPVLVAIAAGLPIGTALLFPATSAMITHGAEESEMGQTLGVQQAFGGVARVAGPIGAAAAFQGLGAEVPFVAAAALLVASLAFVVTAARAHPVTTPHRA
ncbi:MAG: MFS transporter [Gemmatimonadetes bacterium]|nr:MFS transporter [Gemmatimonadota bacterium]